ncbi:MAG: chemotaxis protein MotB [Rhodobacteraceae bacterium HLUCCO07]|nr:MAG: chemotaxis protein MotB [Rhodobacteraceae bacterium HLUCCO07]
MSAQSNAAPVIIKRKKVVTSGDHHGGAWKVAYADFVTAMMAFFLLMWLLNATTEQQRKGVSDYFSPTIPVHRVSGGGSGAFGGESAFSELELPQNGIGATNRRSTEARQARGETGLAAEGTRADPTQSEPDEQTEKLLQIQDALMGRGGESEVPDDIRKHVVSRVTDEGLILEFFDARGQQLFDPGGDSPTELLNRIVTFLIPVLGQIGNGIAIDGHTRARAVVMLENPVWDLSSSRASRMRVALEDAGLKSARFRRVTGHADRSLATDNPMSLRNNRIEIVILRDNT